MLRVSRLNVDLLRLLEQGAGSQQALKAFPWPSQAEISKRKKRLHEVMEQVFESANRLGSDQVEDDQLRPGGPSVHAPPSFPWVPVAVTTEVVSVQPI